MNIVLRHAALADCEFLAALHASCFEETWNADAFRALMARPGCFLMFGGESETELQGFILIQMAASLSEIQSLGVHPSARRKGLAKALLRSAADECSRQNAEEIFLEVAQDNGAAMALYASHGFRPIGRRKGYYQRSQGAVADAIVLRATLPLSQS